MLKRNTRGAHVMLVDESVLEKTVDYALRLGAEYAEARYHALSVSSLVTRNDRLVGVGRGVEEGVAIRVLVKGVLGFASTNSLEWEQLEKTVSRAVSSARALGKTMVKPVKLSEERMGRAKYEVVVKKDFSSESIESKVGLLKSVYTGVRDALSKAKLATLFAELSEKVEEKLYVNSEGARVESRIPRLFLGYNMVLAGDNGLMMNRWYEYSGSGGLELIDYWKVPESIVDEAVRLEKVLVEAREPPRGRMDVVVGDEVVGLIVHESCGHPCEADRVLGREAAQAGESFMKRMKIGDRIGSEHVTIVDDPTVPGSAGFYLYDDEGVPARPKYLYLKGIVNEFLHNRWTASVYGVRSNGSARAMDYKSEPIVRMSNTYMVPGTHSLEELLEDVKHGLYVKSYMEWNIDDERWGQRYVGLEAYLVENGEVKHPVRNPVLEFTTGEFYSKVDAVGKELKFHAGTCGKGEPAQGVPVWFGGPPVRVRDLIVR